MLNAIGLQNPGIDLFIERDIPFLKKYDTRIVVNVCGHTTSEYIEVVDRLADQPVDLLEINISCPNVKEGGIAFGQNPKMVEDITREIKAHAKQPVIMKLSPNVTDITEMARAAEAGGADEMILAGATAVSVGTANFTNPQVTMEIVDGIRDYMERYQVKDIKELVGAVHDR